MHYRYHKAILLLLLAPSVLWLTACNRNADQEVVNAQATIAALSTENARLATAVAVQAPSPLATTAVMTATLAPLAPVTATGTVATPEPVAVQAAAANGPLPTTIAEIALGADHQTLVDFQLDHATNQLYVTDSAGQLHVLDATTYAVLTSIPASATLTLDEAHGRLYAAPGDLAYAEHPAVTVIDTSSLAVVNTIPDASHVALDPAHNRLFVGNRLFVSNEETAPGVRILDATSLTPIAQSPQAGIPVYNPLRDELLIVAYTVLTADPATGEVKADLAPEIAEQSLRWCNGCIMAGNAYVMPEDNLLLLDIAPIAVGKGAGIYPPPRPLDATTLAPLAQLVPPFQPVCGSERRLQPLVDGRSFQYLFYSRYVGYNNLLVYDETGNLITWRDGLALPFVNANTGYGYIFDWVLDLRTLNPVGKLPVRCFFAQDVEQGVLYATQGNKLLVLAEQGGGPRNDPNGDAGALPAQPVTQIVVSPGYANDETLFVISNSALPYRSTTGGQAWSLLRNGLPSATEATRRFAISPDYTQDRTIFLGGYLGDWQGEGVWRSTDGGEQWQAIWNGLTHLRVYDLAVSPHFASDQTLIASARYNRLEPWQAGVSAQRSTDGGLTWSLALTETDTLQTLNLQSLLPAAERTPQISVRVADYGRAIERSADGGQTWTLVTLSQPAGALIQAIVPAPDNPPGDTVYVLGDYGLWRVRDNGATIEAWMDERLAGRDYHNELTALAVSPLLADDSHRLFVGTYAGEFWLLDPATLTWGAPIAATGELTATTAVTATLLVPTPTLPAGTVTPAPPLSGEPPANLYRPQGLFTSQWEKNTTLQNLLGWATAGEPSATAAAAQTFDKGVMIWRADEQKIYVLYNDRTWQVFDDTFQEGQQESDPTIAVPAGKMQPIRGFGKVWRDQPNVRERIGWATAKEQPYDASVHPFEHGFLIRLGGLVYALVEQADGSQVWSVV